MTQHPPLYYAVVAASAHGAASVLAPAGGIAYDQQIWAYRLISILLLAPLPLLCWAVTCHLSVLKPVQLASVTIPLALPGLIFRNGPMVNNDNLLVLLGAVMLLALARVVSGRVGPATTAIVGVSMGAGLLTKGLALVYPVVIAVGYLLAVISARRDRRRRILAHACIALAIGALIGGWWWVRNIELYGTIQPSGVPGYGVVEFDDGPVSPPPGFQPDPADWSGRFTVSIGRSFVGDILFDDRAGDRSQWSWLPGVLFVVGLMLGLIRRNHWQLRALLATAIVSMLAAVALVSLDTYVTFGEFRGGAGRYLYSFLPAIAALLADGYGRLFGRDARWLPLASATLAMILGVEGLRSVLTLRWGQVGDGLSDRWMAVLAWSPPAPAVTNTLLIAAAVGMMAVIVSSVVEGVRSKPLGVSPPPCGEQIPSSAPARSG